MRMCLLMHHICLSVLEGKCLFFHVFGKFYLVETPCEGSGIRLFSFLPLARFSLASGREKVKVLSDLQENSASVSHPLCRINWKVSDGGPTATFSDGAQLSSPTPPWGGSKSQFLPTKSTEGIFSVLNKLQLQL